MQRKRTAKGFRPLSGNLLSLPCFPYTLLHHCMVFVPYRGIYFLYTVETRCVQAWEFSSPIGESTFSTLDMHERASEWKVFVPYRGIYFLYPKNMKALNIEELVFVPYRGIYFLYLVSCVNLRTMTVQFSSPIGESTFSTRLRYIHWLRWEQSFRPLSGNLLSLRKASRRACCSPLFSSPIGESTFSTEEKDLPEAWHKFSSLTVQFSSPIGESTFSTRLRYIHWLRWEQSFRPLSGNLLSLRKASRRACCSPLFSSPIGESTFSTEEKDLPEAWHKFSSPIGESTFSTPASRTPLFIRVPELFCGAKFKNCFSISISYACAAFSLILCGAAQNSFYCRENSILPIPISYNFP